MYAEHNNYINNYYIINQQLPVISSMCEFILLEHLLSLLK